MRLATSTSLRKWAAALLVGATAVTGLGLMAAPAGAQAGAGLGHAEWRDLNGKFKRAFFPLPVKKVFVKAKRERSSCQKAPKASGALESRSDARQKRDDYRNDLTSIREARTEIVTQLLDADDSRALEALARGLRVVNGDLKALAKVAAEFEKAVATYKPNAANRINYKIPGDMEWHNWAKTELEEIKKLVTIEATLKRQILDGFSRVKGGGMAWLRTALAKNKSPEVRAGAAQAVGSSAADGNVDALDNAYGTEKDGFVRVAIIDGLLQRKATDRKATFLKALQDEVWEVRAAAVDAIGNFGFKDAPTIEALIEALVKEDGRLRGDIEEVLHGLTGMRFFADGLLWRKWWADNKAKYARDGPAKPIKGGNDPGFGGGFDAPDVGGAGGAGGAGGGHGGGHTKVSFYGIQTFSNRIAFVLDRSGSMKEKAGNYKKPGGTVTSGRGGGHGRAPKGGPEGDQKIDVAKWELKKAVMGLSSDVKFTIIFYNENVEIWKQELVAATKSNKKAAYKYIKDLPAAGATNIFDSLEKAFGIGQPEPGQVQDKRYSKGGDSPDTIFLLSDGAPNRGRITDPNGILAEIAKMNRLRRIVIHTIGIGKGENRPFMQGLAKQNRGKYVHRD